MIRGTTPTHIFTLPFDVSLIADLRIIYAQDAAEILAKTKDDCGLDGNEVSVTLTQEDTFKFDCKRQVVQIQVRVLTSGGDALASEVIIVPVEQCLNSEVLK
jgi:hypothetical protein